MRGSRDPCGVDVPVDDGAERGHGDEHERDVVRPAFGLLVVEALPLFVRVEQLRVARRRLWGRSDMAGVSDSSDCPLPPRKKRVSNARSGLTRGIRVGSAPSPAGGRRRRVELPLAFGAVALLLDDDAAGRS